MSTYANYSVGIFHNQAKIIKIDNRQYFVFDGNTNDLCNNLLQQVARDLDLPGLLPWVNVESERPNAGEIVFMYSASNNEYSHGHFVNERGGVKVTHWMRLYPPMSYPPIHWPMGA